MGGCQGAGGGIQQKSGNLNLNSGTANPSNPAAQSGEKMATILREQKRQFCPGNVSIHLVAGVDNFDTYSTLLPRKGNHIV
jgi:hypothetical protein